jgi:hypothetical protein
MSGSFLVPMAGLLTAPEAGALLLAVEAKCATAFGKSVPGMVRSDVGSLNLSNGPISLGGVDRSQVPHAGEQFKALYAPLISADP